MPTWGELLGELKELNLVDGKNHSDELRRKYLFKLSEHTDRDTILYATNWSQSGAQIPSDMLSIGPEDIEGFMEVIHGMKRKKLDLIIHSPGGSAESAEAIVKYMRTKYDNVRVIVPQAAMSAATMLACSADSIVMGKHSSLGPIDPQMMILTSNGVKAVPADAIIEQFEYAEEHIEKIPSSVQTWFPLLSQYYPGLLMQCLNAKSLAEELVSNWLTKYMMHGREDADPISCRIAQYLSNHENFKTHGRFIDRVQARELGLTIENLEDDQEFQDLVLSVFHATTLTFGTGRSAKIIENHEGKAFMSIAPPRT